MNIIKDADIIVLKIGSRALIDDVNCSLKKEWFSAFIEDVAELKRDGKQVIIVSSGSVALGKNKLNICHSKLKLEEKQAAAACGQMELSEAYREELRKYNIDTAQILLTLEDSNNRRRFLNARNTITTLLNNNIIPVINENDSVSTDEIRFGDNDRLAARVVQMVGADILVLLSDIDGLYTSNPKNDENSEHIKLVTHIDETIRSYAGGSISNVSSGGMITKIQAAEIAASSGCGTIISLGMVNNPIKSLMNDGRNTLFMACGTPQNARKNWISCNLNIKGSVVIDDGAVTALNNGKSLLPAGILEVVGEFIRGDTIIIKDKDGNELGKGISSYSKEDAVRIAGKRNNDIEAILGYSQRHSFIHRDDMAIS